MCVRRFHYSKKTMVQKARTIKIEKKLFYRCLRSRNYGVSFRSWYCRYIVWDLKDFWRGLQRDRDYLIWNLSYRASALKSKNRRNWWSYRETVEEQPHVDHVSSDCITNVYRLYLHYYPYINLYLCKSLWRRICYKLFAVFSYYSLMFKSVLCFFLLISLEMHVIILLWNDRLFN